MSAQATLTTDLGKITANTRDVVRALGGVEVVAVTKCTCGSPEVGKATLAGGAVALGESRHANAERHRAAGISAPIWLLRAPPPELAADTVRLFDLSLASELETCAALDAAAAGQGRRHQVLVMVDLGDLREGILPADLPAFVDAVEALEHVDLAGVGVNLTCYGAIMPDQRNMSELVELARATERRVGRHLVVGGGNSGSIGMIASGDMPAGVTVLRVGETVLHGVDTLTREPILGLHTDVFELAAPVIECKLKPSLPRGTVAQDAYGNRPSFTDRGDRRRAILALGRQDVMPEYLTPLDAGVEILGASSDHLILDVEETVVPPRLGDLFRFRPNYAATVQLFTSPYVHKVFTPPA
jgi:predicted amino acid racemase